VRDSQFWCNRSDYFGNVVEVLLGQIHQRLKFSKYGKKVLQTRLRTVFEQIGEKDVHIQLSQFAVLYSLDHLFVKLGVFSQILALGEHVILATSESA